MSKKKRTTQPPKAPPREGTFSSANIGIGSAAIAAGWTVASILAKIPELASAGAAGTLGTLSVWQLIKAKFEDRDKDK